jgi:putative ABC transport system permease protein
VAPAIDGSRLVRSEVGTTRGLVLGTTANFLDVRGFRLARGAFFTYEDEEAATRVVVLGARVRAALCPAGEPVGAVVRIANVPFEVVGVLEAQGVTADGADVDTQLYVPLRTALRRMFNTRALGSVFIRVRDEAPMPRVESDLRAVLRERHHLDERERADDFAVQNPERALAAKRQVTRVMTLFTLSVAAISLLVGGTGILALMLLSVRERTAEIGLRRAVGAWPLDILTQFLAEAMTLAAGGGLAGVGLGVLGAWATAAATGWPVSVTASSALAGVGISASLGLVFGLWPASQAARLPPVVALSRA